MYVALAKIFDSNGQIIRLFQNLIRVDISHSSQPAKLFHDESVAGALLTAYSKLVAIPYLRKTFTGVFRQLFQKNESMEVEPTQLKREDHRTDNFSKLLQLCDQLLMAIVNSVGDLPPTFRQICHVFQEEIRIHFPSKRNTSPCTFLFHWFYTVVINVPDTLNLVNHSIHFSSKRALNLASKILKRFSERAKFGTKEEFMMPANRFIEDKRIILDTFVEEVCTLPPDIDDGLSVPLPSSASNTPSAPNPLSLIGLNNLGGSFSSSNSPTPSLTRDNKTEGHLLPPLSPSQSNDETKIETSSRNGHPKVLVPPLPLANNSPRPSSNTSSPRTTPRLNITPKTTPRDHSSNGTLNSSISNNATMTLKRSNSFTKLLSTDPLNEQYQILYRLVHFHLEDIRGMYSLSRSDRIIARQGTFNTVRKSNLMTHTSARDIPTGPV